MIVCVSQNGMGGNTELVNVVYLDNMTLELYHRLLDKHPNATTYRITCVGGERCPDPHACMLNSTTCSMRVMIMHARPEWATPTLRMFMPWHGCPGHWTRRGIHQAEHAELCGQGCQLDSLAN